MDSSTTLDPSNQNFYPLHMKILHYISTEPNTFHTFSQTESKLKLLQIWYLLSFWDTLSPLCSQNLIISNEIWMKSVSDICSHMLYMRYDLDYSVIITPYYTFHSELIHIACPKWDSNLHRERSGNCVRTSLLLYPQSHHGWIQKKVSYVFWEPVGN